MGKEAIEKKIQEIVAKIVEEYQPEKVILYGSWAWGTPGKNSDVDLFIVKNTDRPIRELAREIDGSIFPRPFPIDLIVYTSDQLKQQARIDFFVRNILMNGKVLYAK